MSTEAYNFYPFPTRSLFLLLILAFLVGKCAPQTCPAYKFWKSATSTCQTCSYYCTKCTSISDCTSCDLTNDHRTLFNQRACMCSSGYYDTRASSTCLNCSNLISNCVDCYYNSTFINADAASGAARSGCLQCKPGYVLINGACPALAVCPAGQGPNLANVCQSCQTGCVICSTSTTCTQCNSVTNYFLDISTSKCVLCSLSGCSKCSSLTTCTTCNAGLTLTSSNTCICSSTFFTNPYTFQCQPCSVYCKTCTGPTSYECTSCYDTQNRILVGNQCQCDSSNYAESVSGPICTKIDVNACERGFIKVERTGACVEICGDGWRIGYQCDDGNIINTDGCSDACTIDPGFKCLNNGRAASICRLNTEIQILASEVIKMEESNQLTIKVDVSPDTVAYNNYDLSNVLHFRGSLLEVVSVKYQNGWMQILASYDRNLSRRSTQLQIRQDQIFDPLFPEGQQTMYTTKKSTFSIAQTQIPLNTSNNLLPNYYSDQVYNQVKRTKKGAMAVMIIMLMISIGCLFMKNSLSVIINVNAFQICYISLVTIDGMHPVMVAIKGLRNVLGFNDNHLFSLSGRASVRVESIGFGEDFANNFNIMFFVQVSFLIASILTNFASYKKPMIKLASSILQRNTLLLIFFNLPTVFFTLTLMLKPFMLNIVFACVATGIIIYQLVHLMMKGKDYFAFKEMFDFSDKGHFKKFLCVYFVARLGTCLSFSFINVEPLRSLIAGSVFQGAFIIFISFVRPFYHPLNNIFMILAEVMSISFFGSVYAAQADSALGQNNQESSINSMIYLIGAIMLITMANLIYSIVKDVQQAGKKLKAFNELIQAKQAANKRYKKQLQEDQRQQKMMEEEQKEVQRPVDGEQEQVQHEIRENQESKDNYKPNQIQQL